MDSISTDLPVPSPACPHCHAAVRATDVFCGQCGKTVATETATVSAERQDVFSLLKPTLLYYFITLLLLATFKFTDLFPQGLEGMVIITVIDVLLIIAFWVHDRKELTPLFSLRRIKGSILLLTLLGAVAGSIIVCVVAHFIDIAISDDTFYDTYLFEDTPFPFLISTLFIAVQPAIFEEVAFRGFLFNNLKQVSGATSAIYITGFLFGLMHLTVISLLWLIPMGLIFAFLRNKYNTLWYGMIAHFTYNFCITLFEFKGWFYN